MRDNAPDDGESRCNTSMPLVVEASRSITSPAPVPQAKRHLFPVLASQQAQRISALVRYDAVGAEEDEEAAMHRTRTILPLPLLSWLTVASWRLLTATAVTGLGSGITLKLVSVSKETYIQAKETYSCWHTWAQGSHSSSSNRLRTRYSPARSVVRSPRQRC
jgi:hypothetical protein